MPGSPAGGGGPGSDGSDPEAGLPGRRTGGMAFGRRLPGPLLSLLLGQHPLQGPLYLHLQSNGSDKHTSEKNNNPSNPKLKKKIES